MIIVFIIIVLVLVIYSMYLTPIFKPEIGKVQIENIEHNDLDSTVKIFFKNDKCTSCSVDFSTKITYSDGKTKVVEKSFTQDSHAEVSYKRYDSSTKIKPTKIEVTARLSNPVGKSGSITNYSTNLS
jgi:hypothetical protein